MTDRDSPFTARTMLAEGALWRDEAARCALPILLWLARHGRTITYKQLAEEILVRSGLPIKRRFTLYGKPAGKIGYCLQLLSDEWGEAVPPINVLIVNAATELPGDGADYFISRYLNPRARRMKLDEARSEALRREVIQSVYDYPHWDQVRKELRIGRLAPVSSIDSAEPIRVPRPSRPSGGYLESQQHMNLKRWAAKNPRFFLKFGRFPSGSVEKTISSGDCLDAHLENSETQLAIEVKASNAPASELFRGVFQCVKYRATLRAMQLAAGEFPNAASVLVTTNHLPPEISRLAARLRVQVMVAPKSAETAKDSARGRVVPLAVVRRVA